MHIGNRIFPYPVLNRNEALSDYVEDSVFKVEFDVDESGCSATSFLRNWDSILEKKTGQS